MSGAHGKATALLVSCRRRGMAGLARAARQLAVPLLMVVPAMATVACGRPGSDPGGGTLRPEYDTAGRIPMTPLAGRVGGKPFEMKGAHVVLDRRPGHEGFDVLMSESAEAGVCGSWKHHEAASVWLRFTGQTTLSQGELRRTPKEPSAFEAHVQYHEDGAWHGSSTSAALLVVEGCDPTAACTGVLSVCFADEHRSCVSGLFSALACSDPLDDPPRSFQVVSREEVEHIRKQLADGGATGLGGDGGQAPRPDAGSDAGK